jgi:L-malate glycosyltransferase
MKICFLASADSIHSHKWVNFFSDLGHDVSWISLVASNQKISKKINYYELKNNTFFSIYKVRTLISKLSPDILHVHYLGKYALLGIFSGAKSIVSTPWGSDVIEGKKIFFKKLVLKKILKKSKIITCDAFHMANELEALGTHPSKIHIVNFGIDTKMYSKKDLDANLLNIPKTSSHLSIISLRNFHPVYDIKTLLYAAQILLKDNPDVRFSLFGKGPLEDELKQLAIDLKIENSVYFSGFIDNHLLPTILNSADIYVSTSLSDAGLASSTAEAMACEIPCVITNSADNDKWISSGENGFLFPAGQPNKLANCLTNLINNKQLRNDMGKNGRKIIIKNNDYFIEMKKMNNLYQKIS